MADLDVRPLRADVSCAHYMYVVTKYQRTALMTALYG